MKYANHFKEKIAVITGAGEGLGRALAIKLAENDAIVICTDKKTALAQNTVNTIQSINADSQAQAMCLDVSNPLQVQEVIAEIVSGFGKIDYWFNNAGVTIGGEIRDLKVEHWKKIMDVNLFGLITCSTEVFKLMSKAQQGHIVNITSISGLLDYTALSAPYAVSKHGAVTFSKALQLEALDFNVKVTTVCPGAIKTKIGETMEHVNANENARKRSVEFIQKGISPDLAADTILSGIIKNKKRILFPKAFRNYYLATRIFPSLEKTIALKMIREFRSNDRLEQSVL